VSNVHSFIGRSLYASDAPLYGAIDEFRIYNHALHPAEVAASYAAGPDTPSIDPGALQAIELEVPGAVQLGGVQAWTLRGQYAGVGSLDITVAPGIELTSSAPEVIEVGEGGDLLALSLGTAEIT